VVFAFGSRDALDRENDDGRRQVVFGAEFHRLQLRYEHRLDAGSVRAMTVIGRDRSAQADGDVQLTDSLAQARVDLEQQLSSAWQFQAGADLGLDSYELKLGTLDDPDARQDYLEHYPSRIDRLAGSYVAATWRANQVTTVTFGARFDAYHSGGSTALAPAGSIFADFEISPRLHLIHGLGIAHQPPSANVPQPGSNPVLGAGLQHALQNSAGLRLELPLELRLEATLFQMALFHLSDAIGISRIDNADDSLDENSRAMGSSRGLELQLQRSLSRDLGGYLSYTFSVSRRYVGRAEGPSLFDRRHVLSGAFSYRWGSGFHGGLRGTFYTGVPADVAYLAAARDPPRTTPFYRLDTRIEKRWPLGSDGAYWAIVLEVLNATLHEEALAKSCNAYVCREDRVGPLTVPSIGLEAVF
jgi:hypothetical protein